MKNATLKNTLTVKLLGAAALAVFSLQAQASLIGTLTIGQQDGALGKITADEVQFICSSSAMGCREPDTGAVRTADGIFSSLQGAIVSMYDFNYVDTSADNYFIGHTLWTANNFSMRIDSLANVDTAGTVINAWGDATFFENGAAREDIQGEWYLTLIGNNVVGFTSTAEAYSVPEPGTMALLSIGLAGIGAARRSAARRA